MAVAVAGAVGWVGAIGTVGAYALVSSRRMDANSLRFQAINVAGAGLLAISALSHDNWPSFASNFLWLAFGAHALHLNRHAVNAAVVRVWRHRLVQPLTTVTESAPTLALRSQRAPR